MDSIFCRAGSADLHGGWGAPLGENGEAGCAPTEAGDSQLGPQNDRAVCLEVTACGWRQGPLQVVRGEIQLAQLWECIFLEPRCWQRSLQQVAGQIHGPDVRQQPRTAPFSWKRA